jgi:Kef-type K+ transport system membrane component KefB
MELSSINLAQIVEKRMQLKQALEKTQSVDSKKRIARLGLLEDVLTRSLLIFKQLVATKDLDKIDSLMDQESELIVGEFQKIVLIAKNDQITVGDHKAEEKAEANLNEAKNATSSIVDGVIKDVSVKADKLENTMKDDGFKESQKSKGATIETVIKVNDDKSSNDTSSASNTLIDSHNNQYVLAKSGDITMHVDDYRLLNDLLLVLLVCFGLAFGLHFVKLPTFFGYIAAGVILGPGGFLVNLVQIETISRGLGVILIMFFLGLEFNLEKIKKVINVSLFGTLLLFSLTVGVAILLGTNHGMALQSCIAVGSSIFLSSTVVCIHFLKQEELETEYGRTIIGILVLQDLLLGFLLVIMPALHSTSTLFSTIIDLFSSLLLFTSSCIVLRYPLTIILSWLNAPKRQELFLLGSLGLCLLIMKIGIYFKQSTELSCFVAGLICSSEKPLAESISRTMKPLHQVFGALFFASLGLHIYPSFLYNEGTLLISLTIGTMLIKTVLTFLVMKLIFTKTAKDSILVAVGLGQISEFTFVLASTAKATGVIEREAFYLLVGVTTLSMLFSPFLWSLAKVTCITTKNVVYEEVTEV